MANIVAIHCGAVKTYHQDGTTFHTAIDKKTVTGPVEVIEDGIKGNEVANHDNAIYGCCVEAYAYWQQALNLTGPWPYGWLGENITMRGIDESQVSIGDLFRINDVLLRVSGCRTPCRTLLWKTGLGSDFLPQFQRSGHTGFYLQVLQTGPNGRRRPAATYSLRACQYHCG